ncbi:MAG: hypothetical protein QF902_11685 [Rhodospirillales bacterium]|jgi:hypothetical protein|nr:hypothetical protein [Rhodospirillales bacterium]
MRALKALVIGMGILIVVGMALIAYGLYSKATDPGFAPFSTDDDPTPAFGEASITLPSGCTIVEVQPDGARLYLRIGPPINDCERVIVLDALSGEILGTVEVTR